MLLRTGQRGAGGWQPLPDFRFPRSPSLLDLSAAIKRKVRPQRRRRVPRAGPGPRVSPSPQPVPHLPGGRTPGPAARSRCAGRSRGPGAARWRLAGAGRPEVRVPARRPRRPWPAHEVCGGPGGPAGEVREAGDSAAAERWVTRVPTQGRCLAAPPPRGLLTHRALSLRGGLCPPEPGPGGLCHRPAPLRRHPKHLGASPGISRCP